MDEWLAFTRLIGALRPWLDDLVIVGGWAHRLYRLRPHLTTLAYQPPRTLDADIAFAATASLAGDMGAALTTAGFRAELAGEHTPPVTWYHLGGQDDGFYAEFLAPLTGSGRTRRGLPDATLSKAGVTAQKLRYVDLLLTAPWQVRLDTGHNAALDAVTDVRVPNPVSFIIQKLLIAAQRPPAKQAQDVLYVHDTLELFGGQLEELRGMWQAHVRPALPETTAASVAGLARAQYGVVRDVHRSASRIPQDRVVSAEGLRRLCAYGLGEILGA